MPDRERRHQPFPLTDLQQAYWVGERGGFELGNVSAHRYVEFECHRLDVDRVSRAWHRIIQRHEMLRAIILPDGRQQILADVPLYPIEVHDLVGQSRDRAAARLDAVRARLSNEGRPSHRWPLFEVCIHHLDDEVSRLHISTNLIIHDGLSLKLVLDDLFRLYEDPGAALPAFELSFRDYRLALEAESSSARAQRDLAYWRGRLATLPPAPELPLAKSPGSVASPLFRRWNAIIAPVDWARLKKRAFKAGLTASCVLCAAYAEVIAVWAKRPHFTLNFLSGNRERLHPEVKDVVGPFSSTIPLEVNLSVPDTFLARTQRLQEQLASDVAHGSVSGVQVTREAARLQGWSSMAALPIVFANVLFAEGTTVQAPPRGWRKIYHAVQTAQVYLDHQVREEDGALVLNWDCVPEVFPEGLLDDMFEAYCGLVQRLATDDTAWTDPDTRAKLIPRAHLELQRAINATEAPVPGGLLHTRFAMQAARTPDAIAVVSRGRNLTYQELDRRSNQVAHWLRRAGATPNNLVAVAMEKGWEQIVAVVGILKSGAAYLPVDPTYPRERIDFLLTHERRRADRRKVDLGPAGQERRTRADRRQRAPECPPVLTQSWLDDAARWPEDVRRLCIDADELLAEDDRALDAVQGPDDLAYVIYTSGSTGQPKGVMIEHRSALNTICDLNERLGVGPTDRTIALSALNFDLSVYDVFGMLAAGGAVVIPDTAATRDPAAWAELVRTERVTIWSSVPTFMQMLVEHLEAGGRRELESLRFVCLSGDWIPVTLPARIRAIVPGAQLVSMGGATEAAIWSIIYPIANVDPGWRSIPYGRPMRNQRFYVLDQNLALCPVWVPGELYIAGVGLARGYFRDEHKTQRAFFDHPVLGERLYRTGDWGRFTPSGDIEFLGREDSQVKVRGFRIELGEIETILRQHPAVHETIVVAAPADRRAADSPATEKILIGYVVATPETELAIDDLRAFLGERLPDYMVPSVFVALDELPLSANGKVDRGRLPAPHAANRASRSFVPPRDGVERELAQLWERVLGVDSIGATDNFFELGGHSLLALRMLAQVHARFGVELPLSVLFDGGTIERLAAKLKTGQRARTSPLVAIRPTGSKVPFACVHPAGGNVLCYTDLARLLGADQPFYALQSDPTSDAAVSIEAMAAGCIDALLAARPRGPFRLGGWSFGGLVAFEMARQLRARGEEVDRLVLIDSWPSSDRAAAAADGDHGVIEAFVRDLGGWRVRSPWPARAAIEPHAADDRLVTLLEPLRAAQIVPSDISHEVLAPMLEVFKRNVRAAARYVPSACTEPLTLFRTQRQEFADFPDPADDPTYGWQALTSSPVEVHEFPGNHYTLLAEPIVSDIATALRRCLDGA